MKLSEEKIQTLSLNNNLENLSVDDIFSIFLNNKNLKNKLPEVFCYTDPRNKNIVMHSPQRSIRPINPDECAICHGNTTTILDTAKLSKGYTFINMNMYPAVYPFLENNTICSTVVPSSDPLPKKISGLHFLQWTSSYHDEDWHNLPVQDCKIVLDRLALLEKKLLLGSKKYFLSSKEWSLGKETFGFLSIIKNMGTESGSSMSHGHQQIIYSNTMSKTALNNWVFLQQHGKVFSKYLLEENPKELLVKEYKNAALIVPTFMHRPYHFMLTLKNTDKQFFYELDEAETSCLAEGIHDASFIMSNTKNMLNQSISYNVLFHNGPGAGIYIEFLPCTNRIGGFEHLGLWISIDSSLNVVKKAKEILS